MIHQTTIPYGRSPVDSFVACLEAEGKAGTDTGKFPPIEFTVSDQQDLRALHTLANLTGSKPSAIVRRCLRSQIREAKAKLAKR